jgi:hypothetical protein
MNWDVCFDVVIKVLIYLLVVCASTLILPSIIMIPLRVIANIIKPVSPMNRNKRMRLADMKGESGMTELFRRVLYTPYINALELLIRVGMIAISVFLFIGVFEIDFIWFLTFMGASSFLGREIWCSTLLPLRNFFKLRLFCFLDEGEIVTLKTPKGEKHMIILAISWAWIHHLLLDSPLITVQSISKGEACDVMNTEIFADGTSITRRGYCTEWEWLRVMRRVEEIIDRPRDDHFTLGN